mmetsp:Transcript_39528/g.86254  ORF Transcript_39528/g.86254 Transcript_39528/m.86254 type:complete len:346 (-) Transcript_39528:477-1514(-)
MPQVGCELGEALAVLPFLLEDHFVDDAEVLQLGCVDVLQSGQGLAILGELLLLAGLISVPPQNGRGPLGGDGGIVSVGQHTHLIAHSHAEGPARATLTDDDGDNGNLETRHFRQVRRDSFRLPRSFCNEGGPCANAVHQGHNREAETLSHLEQTKGSPVPRRGGHGVVVRLTLRRAVPLPTLDDHTAASGLEHRQPTPQTLVQPHLAISPKLLVGRGDGLHHIVGVVPLQGAGLQVVHFHFALLRRRSWGVIHLVLLARAQHVQALGHLVLKRRLHSVKAPLLRHNVHLPILVSKLSGLKNLGALGVVCVLVHPELGVQNHGRPGETDSSLGSSNSDVRLHSVGS